MNSPRNRFLSLFWLLLAALLISGRAAGAQTTATPAPTVTPRPVVTIHVVQRGETLYHIALMYGTSVDEIARANGIANPAQITVGQRLLIPGAKSGTSAASIPGALISYTVGPADTLYGLALRFGSSVDQIAARNAILNPDLLFIGQDLTLQAGSGGLSPVTKGRIYVVQPTDTLYRIALRFGMPLGTLAKANRMTSYSRLEIGQHLVIPGDDKAPLFNDLPYPATMFSMQPEASEQGRTIALTLQTETPVLISGQFLGQSLIDRSDDHLVHHLWLAAPAMQAAGLYSLSLMLTNGQGEKVELNRILAVRDGGYFSERITLPSDQLDLLDPKITDPELKQILGIVAPVTPKRYFEGPMGLPVPAAITSQYGTRRSYNGGPYNQFHTGTDFGSAPGSPIFAPAPGKVVFTGRLYVRGNATIIDHGWGVYTGYWHQTEILVNVGDEIKTGQIIGKIGSTGRVTGPHLHWELFVNGIQVDPIQWVRAGFN